MTTSDLEGPPPFYSEPGPDEDIPTVDDLVDMLLARVGADHIIDQSEAKAIARLQAGLQMIAQQQMAIGSGQVQPGGGMVPQGPGETQPFGTTDGTEERPMGSPTAQPFQG